MKRRLATSTFELLAIYLIMLLPGFSTFAQVPPSSHLSDFPHQITTGYYYPTYTAEDLARAPKSVGSDDMSKITSVANWIQKLLPSEKLRCAYKKVDEFIRPDAYGSQEVASTNYGIMSHFNSVVTENPCFAKVSEDFWTEAGKDGQVNGRVDFPKMTDKAGEGRYQNVKPGWIWQRALEATKGNPNAAMELIGMCMHDDLASSPTRAIDGKEKAEYFTKKIAETNKLIADDRSKMIRLETQNAEWELLDSSIKASEKELQDLMENMNRPGKVNQVLFICPDGNSAVYAPQSLDSNLDLPPGLKKAIIAIQRPGGDTSSLPAKTYHFAGAAYLGCQLAQCGVGPDEAGEIAKTLANFYRGARLCAVTKKSFDEIKKLQDDVGLSANSPDFQSKAADKVAEAIMKDRSNLFLDMKAFNNSENADDEDRRKFADLKKKLVDKEFEEMDASALYNKWYLGGPNSLIPCTGYRISGPVNLSDVNPQTGEKTPADLGTRCGFGWSATRCEKARKRLATWDVDFAWTEKQHELGAKFGASKCRPQSADEKIDSRICQNIGSGSGASVLPRPNPFTK
jgi:hypothetical protein